MLKLGTLLLAFLIPATPDLSEAWGARWKSNPEPTHFLTVENCRPRPDSHALRTLE